MPCFLLHVVFIAEFCFFCFISFLNYYQFLFHLLLLTGHHLLLSGHLFPKYLYLCFVVCLHKIVQKVWWLLLFSMLKCCVIIFLWFPMRDFLQRSFTAIFHVVSQMASLGRCFTYMFKKPYWIIECSGFSLPSHYIIPRWERLKYLSLLLNQKKNALFIYLFIAFK